MASTALNLVNRVLRKARRETVNDVTGDLAMAILDCVNDAAQEILEMKAWPFLNRTDGIFTTTASWTGTAANFASNPTFTVPLADSPNGLLTDITGNKVSRMILTADTNYGDQSFKVVTALTSGTDALGSLEVSVPGASGASNAYRIFAAEYTLPVTVGDVMSMRIEQEDLRLEPIDEQWSFNRAIPTPHRDIAQPEIAMVGGKSVESYDGASAAPEPGTRCVLFPIPDKAYIVRYDYRYRFVRMTAATDTISGVPEYILTDIVEWAFSVADGTAIFNNPTRSALNRSAVERATERHGNRSKRQQRRKELPSIERSSPRSSVHGFGTVQGTDYGSLSSGSNSVLGGTRTTD